MASLQTNGEGCFSLGDPIRDVGQPVSPIILCLTDDPAKKADERLTLVMLHDRDGREQLLC